jgi:aryl-alcohol dehydrogenase-like predicted oxidoreductase
MMSQLNVPMPTRPLGRTCVEVPLICLGTMTWGEQNSQNDAFAQMDLALELGVHFWDTAEVYAVPIRAETSGLTETYIGNYFASRGVRDEVFLATKISGPSERFKWMRDGKLDFTARSLKQAVEGSLKRLQTDRIDLYQLHWPERAVPIFGQREYIHAEAPETSVILDRFLETLQALQDLIQEGKILHVGLSNETPWGAMQYLELAKTHGLPRMASIQNCYNVLNRTQEVGLSEVMHREDIGLLAYSPLAMGILSGKYLHHQNTKGSRMALFGEYFARYTTPKAQEAVQRYADLAHAHGLTPTQLALAFVNHQPFVTSNIIGATTLQQLEENIRSVEVQLTSEVLHAINAIHEDLPNPCP